MLGVSELLTEVIARIEPGPKSLRLSRWCLPELELRLAGRFQAVVGDRENGCLQVLFVLIEDLNDVPVRRRIHQLHDVHTWRQHLVGYLNRFIDCKNGFLVPLIRAGTWSERGSHEQPDRCNG